MKVKKFRAWYKHDNPPLKFEQETKEGEYCRLVHRDEKGDEYSYSVEVVMCDDNWIVEEWTGKKDLNGKDIYEGDVVCSIHRRDKPLYEVLWSNSAMQWIVRNLTDKNSNSPLCYSSVEVIDNIHNMKRCEL